MSWIKYELFNFFSEQARQPSGLFGRIVMPVVFDRGNAFLNGFVNSLMAVQPNDRVLEIGCGTGKLINIMAKKIDNGIISGIDFSYTKESFTKACSVNTLYFWKNIENTISKVFDLLESGGQFIVAFEDIKQLEQRKLSDKVSQLYTDSDVKRLLTNSGFSNGVYIETRMKSCKGRKAVDASKNAKDEAVPEGFCVWAWADMRNDIKTVAYGGDIPGMKQRGTFITACTDWLRPMIFKVERMDSV